MNLFDLDSARQSAQRKCQKRYKEIVDKFHRPLVETDIGEMMAAVRADPAAYQYLRQAKPAAMKQMEARYGTNQSAGE